MPSDPKDNFKPSKNTKEKAHYVIDVAIIFQRYADNSVPNLTRKSGTHGPGLHRIASHCIASA